MSGPASGCAGEGKVLSLPDLSRAIQKFKKPKKGDSESTLRMRAELAPILDTLYVYTQMGEPAIDEMRVGLREQFAYELSLGTDMAGSHSRFKPDSGKGARHPPPPPSIARLLDGRR
jgi:hypothetical protein